MDNPRKNRNFEQSLEEYRQFVIIFEREPTQKESWWKSEMRKKFNKGKLTEYQINEILKVNPNFFYERQHLPSFNKNLEKYAEFITQNKRFPLYKEMQWIGIIKKFFKKGKLTENQVNEILKVNPNFFEDKRGLTSGLTSFDKNLEKYVEFKYKYKRFPLYKEMRWIGTIRNLFKKGKLNEYQINEILKVNPNFFEKGKIKWDESLRKYERFLLTEFREPTSKEMTWHMEQRSLFKKGKLNEYQINNLIKVNPNFFEKQSKIRVNKNI